MNLTDAYGMAKSIDPDQTAPLGSGSALSVNILNAIQHQAQKDK